MNGKLQKVLMNNHIDSSKSNISNQLIWDNIGSSDIEILTRISNKISNPYLIKLNFIVNILNLDIPLPIESSKDIIKLFNSLSPLNIEYNLGSNIFNKKIVQNKMFLQNSISKKEASDIFYLKYINKVKNLLIKSGIEFDYFEFKSKRFNKTKDIIWVFNLEQFNK